MEPKGSLPCSQKACYPRPCVTFCNKLVLYNDELLAPCPPPKLDNHHLLTTCDDLVYSTKVCDSFFLSKALLMRVKFISDSMSYTTLRGHWCNTTVLNVHTPTEDKVFIQRSALIHIKLVKIMGFLLAIIVHNMEILWHVVTIR
jgi:hypothetical protein